MAPTYNVEELLAVRDSVSESAVSLDKFGDEEAIKAHVLRPSASTSAINTDPQLIGKTTTSVTSVPKDCAIVRLTINKASPTSSLKKAKAERLIKEHGSPPGRRVTAGGRIVPTDFSIGSPSHPFAPWLSARVPRIPTHSQDNMNRSRQPNGCIIYDQNGRLCQMVDGSLRVIQDGQLFMAAPNWPFQQDLPHQSLGYRETGSYHALRELLLNTEDALTGHTIQMAQDLMDLHKLSLDLQIAYLRGKYDETQKMCNDLERSGVLHEKGIDARTKAMMVRQKVAYVKQMDHLRRARMATELHQSQRQQAGFDTSQPEQPDANFVRESPNTKTNVNASFFGAPMFNYSTATTNDFPQYQGMVQHQPYPAALSHGYGGYPSYHGSIPMYNPLYPPPLFASPQNLSYQPAPVQEMVQAPKGTTLGSPTTSNDVQDAKRSHAVKIKKPDLDTEKLNANKSSLDPTSPAFESTAPNTFVPPSPSMIGSPATHPAIANTWLDEKQDVLVHKSSLSTTDFFPNEAAEHSRTKHAFPSRKDLPEGAQVSAFSGQVHNTTPQKDWVLHSQTSLHAASHDLSEQRAGLGLGSATRLRATRSMATLNTSRSYESYNSARDMLDTKFRNARRIATGNNSSESVQGGKSSEWIKGYTISLRGQDVNINVATASIDFLSGYLEGRKVRDSPLTIFQTPDKSSPMKSSLASARSKSSQLGRQLTDVTNFGKGSPIWHDPQHTDTVVEPKPTNTFPVGDRTSLGSYENLKSSASFGSTSAGRSSSQKIVNSTLPLQRVFSLQSTPQNPGTLRTEATVSQNTLSDKRHPSQTNATAPGPLNNSPTAQSKTRGAATTLRVGQNNEYVWKDLNPDYVKAARAGQTKTNTLISSNRVTSAGMANGSATNRNAVWPITKDWANPTSQESKLERISRRRMNNPQTDGAIDFTHGQHATAVAPAASNPNTRDTTAVTPAHHSTSGVEGRSSIERTPDVGTKKTTSPTKVKEVKERLGNRVRRMTGGDKVETVVKGKHDNNDKDRRRSQWRSRFRDMQK